MRRTIESSESGRSAFRGRGRSAFTLIELLVVIVITTVLLLLLFGPLIQGFQLTARAQTTTQAQDASRVAMEQISREVESASAVRDTSRQYLDMLMYLKDGSETIAHSYNAYLDIVPPRTGEATSKTVTCNSSTYTTTPLADPTVDPNRKTFTTNVRQNSAGVCTTVIENQGAGLPIAPGTTLVRYFVGLRHPINFAYTPSSTTAAVEEPYSNRDEGQFIPAGSPYAGSDTVIRGINNTYVLYRAEVAPYTATTTGGVTTNTVNANYFDTDSTGAPILDDPDFFRVVSAGYKGLTTAQIRAHNNRLYHWYQVARPIIDLPDVNLIFQPHDGSGNVVYSTATTGPLAMTPAGTLLDTLPDGSQYPLLRTSVSFGPATVSNDPMNATATADTSQGYGSAPGDAGAYIPSRYRATSGSWHGGPNIVIAQPGGATFTTYLYTGAGKTGVAFGDLVEAQGTTDVYNVTQNTVLGGATNYVAMTIDGDSGVVNFALQDKPAYNAAPVLAGSSTNTVGNADQANINNPYWFITYGKLATNDTTQPLQIDLAGATGDPFLLPGTALATVPNAHMVVNSERIYGPEQEPGPGSADPTAATAATGTPATYPLVPYHRVTFNPGAITSIGYDQYMVDYDNGVIYLGTQGKNLDMTDTYDQRRTVLVASSFQNNLVETFSGGRFVSAQADSVRATYQTGSQVEVAVGVRVYDPSNKQPTYFSLANRVAVGNSGR